MNGYKDIFKLVATDYKNGRTLFTMVFTSLEGAFKAVEQRKDYFRSKKGYEVSDSIFCSDPSKHVASYRLMNVTQPWGDKVGFCVERDNLYP